LLISLLWGIDASLHFDGQMTQAMPPHLVQLEAESIAIMREAVAEFKKPVMLYSIGKDSSVLLHLALKAFYPGPPPFPAAAY